MSDLAGKVVAPPASAARIYGVVLSVGVVCALAIVTVYEVTRPIIQRNRIESRRQAILKVLPGAIASSAFRVSESNGTIEPTTGDAESADIVYAGYDDDGQLVGLAIETRGMGYQDVIRLLYGYSFSAEAVIGIDMMESRETPGLGDRIEKDADFLRQFENLDVQLNRQGAALANEIEFVKPAEKKEAWQIDGITGATISSRAVAEMLRESTSRWIPQVHGRQAEFVMTEQEDL